MAKREQAKRNMDQLAAQLADLQYTVKILSDQVQEMHEQLRNRHDARCSRYCHLPMPTSVQASPSLDDNNDSSSNVDTDEDLERSTGKETLMGKRTTKRSLHSAYCPSNLIKCFCGVEHRVNSECLEYSVFTILFNTHKSLAEGKDLPITAWIPRTPPLISIFYLTISTNPVMRILGSLFRQVHPTKASTFLACYLLMYRYLRWRLYPDEETFRDVPKWMRETEIQRSVPHPVCVDFIPWPKVRDNLLLRRYTNPRHSVSLFIRSIRFRWPNNKVFDTISARGELLLDPMFERAIYQYGNWQISKEWTEMFPSLRDHVNTEDDDGD